TAVAVQVLDAELVRHASSAKRNAAERLQRAESFGRSAADRLADLDAEVEVSAAKADYLKMREFAVKQEANRQAHLKAAADAAAAAIAAQQTITPPSAQFRKVSDGLQVLGKEETVWQ